MFSLLCASSHIYKRLCLSLSWLVCQSIAQMSKPRITVDPGVNLNACNLPTFIHYHSLSFTFIHFHSFPFTFICVHQKCLSIKNVLSYILSQQGTYWPFFSVEKNSLRKRKRKRPSSRQYLYAILYMNE